MRTVIAALRDAGWAFVAIFRWYALGYNKKTFQDRK